MFSTPAPFALSLSKGKRRVLQHPARVKSAWNWEGSGDLSEQALRGHKYSRLCLDGALCVFRSAEFLRDRKRMLLGSQ